MGPLTTTSSTDGAPSKDPPAGDEGGESESESESEEESEGEEESNESETSVDPSTRLINSGPLKVDNPVDTPVTSGSDAMLDPGSTD